MEDDPNKYTSDRTFLIVMALVFMGFFVLMALNAVFLSKR